MKQFKHKNVNLGHFETRKIMYDFLEKHDIKIKTEYIEISKESDLRNIKMGDYIICPKFSGTRSWIIFLRHNYNYYAVNFSKTNANRKNTILFPIEISVSGNFYRGTIMEGTFFKLDNKKYLIIDEIYILSGENQMLKSKEDRLNNLTECLKKQTNTNPNYLMYVCQFFNIDKMSLVELYDKIKNDVKIREIIFFPKIYGGKIYSYTLKESDLCDDVIKLTTFCMKKTKDADVYKLSTIDTGDKMGIAYIPDIATSKLCKQWFKNKKTTEFFVKCKLDPMNQKWIPMHLVEKN